MKRTSAFFLGLVALVAVLWPRISLDGLKRWWAAAAPAPRPSVATSTVPVASSTAATFTGDRSKPYALDLRSGDGADALRWSLTVDGRIHGYAYADDRIYEAYGDIVTSTDQLVFSASRPDGSMVAAATGTWAGSAFSGTVLAGAASSSLRLDTAPADAARITFARVSTSWESADRQLGCEFGLVLPTVEAGGPVSAAAADRINRELRSRLLADAPADPSLAPRAPARTPEQARDRFVRSCQDEVRQESADWRGGEAGGMFHRAQDASVEVTLNRGGWLSFAVDTYAYLGGAHGSSARDAYVFDMRTGALAELDTFIRPEALPAFMQLVARTLVREYADNLFDDNRVSLAAFAAAPADRAARLWADGSSGMPTSTVFYLVPNGVQVVFQQYEIAPYSTGLPQAFIPYRLWRDLADPRTALPF